TLAVLGWLDAIVFQHALCVVVAVLNPVLRFWLADPVHRAIPQPHGRLVLHVLRSVQPTVDAGLCLAELTALQTGSIEQNFAVPVVVDTGSVQVFAAVDADRSPAVFVRTHAVCAAVIVAATEVAISQEAATGTARAVHSEAVVSADQAADVAVEPVVTGAIAVVAYAIVVIVAGAVVPAVATALAAGPDSGYGLPVTG